MDKYNTTVKIRENFGLILLANDCTSSCPDIPIARTPNNGKPTPVNKNPMIAGQRLVPDACHNAGGKIKFPAPKNKANSISPIATISLFEIFEFIAFASWMI